MLPFRQPVHASSLENRSGRQWSKGGRRADVHEAFLTLGFALTTWRYLKREF
jgi:hypothetical protein